MLKVLAMGMGAFLCVTIAGVVSCTFPDVTYVDGPDSDPDGGATDGADACAELAGCKFTAEGCSGVALQSDMMCWQHCEGNQQCEGWCHDTLNAARLSCASTCEMCAPSACGDMTAACESAADVGGQY